MAKTYNRTFVLECNVCGRHTQNILSTDDSCQADELYSMSREQALAVMTALETALPCAGQPGYMCGSWDYQCVAVW